MRPLHKFIAAFFAVLLVAGPASASHTATGEPFQPVYTESSVYLHCSGAAKANNAHAAAESKIVSWDATKPTASYTSGAGCGTADTFLGGTSNQNPLYDFPMRGTFTGNLNNMTIRLWAIEASGSRALNEFTVDLHLEIDGVPVLTRNADGTGTPAHATPVASSTGLTRLYEVTVSDIGFSSEEDHEMAHDVALTVYPKYVDGSGVVAWVYDASEIDSGLIFNDATPAAMVVPRNG